MNSVYGGPKTSEEKAARKENGTDDLSFMIHAELIAARGFFSTKTKEDKESNFLDDWSSNISGSTSISQVPKFPLIEEEITEIIKNCTDDLDHETEEVLSNNLNRLFVTNEFLTLLSLIRVLRDEKINPFLKVEFLSLIGKMTSPPTYQSRRWILENSLESKSKYVRDGAGIGLANMNDPQAIPYIEKAIQAETSQQVRKNLQLVLSQLEKNLVW